MEIINYPIKPEKEKAWHYKSHPYFTKQAANVVAAYIEHYTKAGDTVLDPFGGTGVTAIEALRLKRKAIILDINPLACFLVEQTCAKIDVDLFMLTFSQLESSCKEKIEYFYSLTDQEAIDELNKKKYWYPKNIKMPSSSDVEFQYVTDLFTPRQLLSLAFLFSEIKKIKDVEMRELMKYVFSANLTKVNRTFWMDPKEAGGGQSAIMNVYRYWKPKESRELQVWERFKNRFQNIKRGKEKWNAILNGFSVKDNLQVIHGSALEISKYVPEQSVDYIYTDPPYGGNIAYLDLSTMWNAWLFPEIFKGKTLETLQKDEVIEGGELQKDQKTYEILFVKTFEEMGKVLKKGKWNSVVFAHKKFEFWNTIIDACEDNGMEYKGSTYQPTNNSSVHYKKNPANVLCSQRIASFQKTFNRSDRPQIDDLQKFILNEIERAILETNGAAFDVIYQKVTNRMLGIKNSHELRKKGYDDLSPFLGSERFEFRENTQKYYIKAITNKNMAFQQSYMAHLDEMRIYIKELLYKYQAMTIDEIQKELFEIFARDKKVPFEKDLPIVLTEVARIAKKGKYKGKWVLNKSEAMTIDFTVQNNGKLVKIETSTRSHSEIIFRLVKIGEYLGFKTWIGKREQSVDTFQGFKFSDLSIPNLNLAGFENLQGLDKKWESQKAKIEQIDVIWIDKLGFPRYAFEVEESTTIVSGFERFMNILEVQPDIAKKLLIVAPQSREKKLNDVFRNSTYIGHPIYLENKVQYIFKEKLIEFYDAHLEKTFSENDLKVLFQEVSL